MNGVDGKDVNCRVEGWVEERVYGGNGGGVEAEEGDADGERGVRVSEASRQAGSGWIQRGVRDMEGRDWDGRVVGRGVRQGWEGIGRAGDV